MLYNNCFFFGVSREAFLLTMVDAAAATVPEAAKERPKMKKSQGDEGGRAVRPGSRETN